MLRCRNIRMSYTVFSKYLVADRKRFQSIVPSYSFERPLCVDMMAKDSPVLTQSFCGPSNNSCRTWDDGRSHRIVGPAEGRR